MKQSDTAESFEKTLSALATKISSTSAHNDRLRQRARKLKVGWTLYGGFAYILAFLILTLVTGWQNWGPMELSVVAGGPVLYARPLGSPLLCLVLDLTRIWRK